MEEPLLEKHQKRILSLIMVSVNLSFSWIRHLIDGLCPAIFREVWHDKLSAAQHHTMIPERLSRMVGLTAMICCSDMICTALLSGHYETLHSQDWKCILPCIVIAHCCIWPCPHGDAVRQELEAARPLAKKLNIIAVRKLLGMIWITTIWGYLMETEECLGLFKYMGCCCSQPERGELAW